MVKNILSAAFATAIVINFVSNKSFSSEDALENVVSQKIIQDAKNNLKEGATQYIYGDQIFDEIIGLVVNIFFQNSKIGDSEFIKSVLEFVKNDNLSSENINYIFLAMVLDKVINENMKKKQAFDITKTELIEKTIESNLTQEQIKAAIYDCNIYYDSVDIRKFIEELKNINLEEERKELKSEIPLYTKAQSLRKGDSFVSNEMTEQDKTRYLYGIYSTFDNSKTGIYVNQKGESFVLPKIEKAKTAWEIFETEVGDLEGLKMKVSSCLKDLEKPFENTTVTQFEGSVQDAAIQFGGEKKIALVSFANGKQVGGQSLFGKIGQEELNIHCTAGLFESLALKEEDVNLDNLFYENTFLSPEIGLYSANVSIVKRFSNDMFSTAPQPIPVDVISIAGIDFSSAKQNVLLSQLNITSDPYEEIDRRIELMFALAAKNNADVLILGKYNMGKYNADPKKISAIYNKYIQKYDGYIEQIILAAGGLEPYA